TGFVLDLWRKGKRVAPFGSYLPKSTEQVITRNLDDDPVEVKLTVSGARIIHEDDLGRLEAGVLMDAHVGHRSLDFWKGWGGDRYALLETPDGKKSLVWVTVWDTAPGRTAFIDALSSALAGFPESARLTPLTLDGRPAAELRVGVPQGVAVSAKASIGK
ncbi:MAG: hypothetical protein LJF04_02365, partial [Gemmatimonadetes bacterium]|nr:hypothetical protein [Gemmatimonadota bacterium]